MVNLNSNECLYLATDVHVHVHACTMYMYMYLRCRGLLIDHIISDAYFITC